MKLNYFDDRGVPDLQKLVELFGGYDKITPEVWAQWDADMAGYHARRRLIPAAD